MRIRLAQGRLIHQAETGRTFARRRACLLLLVGLVMGCDPVVDPSPVSTGPKGIYVINEGSYLASNAELSYIGEDRVSASGSVFSTMNPGRTLGDIAQHGAVANGKLYVVVNNSRKIEVLEAGTHRSLQTIALLRAPRYIEVVSESKAYVSNMDSTISVLDLRSGAVLRDLVVGSFPEGMVHSGDRLYVCNSAWGYGASVSIVNVSVDSVIGSIATPPGPTFGINGISGLVHVLCTGYSSYGSGPDVPGAILTLEGSTGRVIDTLALTYPAGKIANDAAGDIFVTVTGGPAPGVWKISGGASPSVVSSSLVSGLYYGIGVDDARSELYLATAGDFVNNGVVHVRSLSGGTLRTYTSGIGVAPNGFVVLP